MAPGPEELKVLTECDEIDRKVEQIVLVGDMLERWNDSEVPWTTEDIEWLN